MKPLDLWLHLMSFLIVFQETKKRVVWLLRIFKTRVSQVVVVDILNASLISDKSTFWWTVLIPELLLPFSYTTNRIQVDFFEVDQHMFQDIVQNIEKWVLALLRDNWKIETLNFLSRIYTSLTIVYCKARRLFCTQINCSDRKASNFQLES